VREELLSKQFVLMLLVQFSFGLAYSTFFLLPKYLSRELHASAAAIGTIASLALLSGVCAVPLIGAALDMRRLRVFMVSGALVNGLSAYAFAQVHAIGPTMYALRIINGISYALVFNANVTLATNLSPPHKLARAIGLCGAASMVSNAVAPWVAENLAESYGWQLVFELAAASALVAALFSLGVREPERGQSATPAASDAESPSALRIALEPARRGAFIGGAAAGAAFGVMFTFTQPYALALGATRVSGFFLGFTSCALIVRLFFGGLADHFGRQRVSFLALSGYGAVVAMTAFLRYPWLPVLGAGLGFAHGLLYPALNALAVQEVPPARRGGLITYFGGAFNSGFALCVFGFGFVAKAYGYPIVFLLCAALVGLALLGMPRPMRGVRV